MKRISNLALILLFCATMMDVSRAESMHYAVQAVEDGDTLVILVDGLPTRVQLRDIDAPEDVDNPKLRRDIERTGLDAQSLQLIGSAATQHLHALIGEGQVLNFEGDLNQHDRYGRVPVEVVDANGRSINEAMVKDGYAIAIKRGASSAARYAQLVAAARQAQQAGRGLWQEAAETFRLWGGF